MKDQHRATESEWYCLEARTCGDKSDVVAYSTILELRDRIEALEAATTAKPNHPAKPDSSLVDRVSFAICPDGQGTGFRTEAREAIREVAAWLREEKPRMAGNCSSFASSLEQEAER